MSAVRANELFYLYRASYGDVAALRGLSLDVADGEVVSVLGPSGSGKSTLLRLCGGRARPASGELSVLDVPMAEASARDLDRLRRSSIGVVRQHYRLSLPRELTVEEIVTLPLQLVGRRSRDVRREVARLLHGAGLSHRSRAHPVELSGGEQQRVAVCAALAKRPRLVLADEPTGELDTRASAAVMGLLLELAADAGSAALIVTHDPRVAEATQRTIHIRDGRLAAEGTTRPVLIVDEQGWLRLPRRLREQAGLRERVRAQATWGKVELFAEEPERATLDAPPVRLDATDKRSVEVALDRITKSYEHEDTAIVDQLSWTFSAERLHVIAGPSGSGKTTVLNMLAVLDYPNAGEVWIGGERMDTLNGNDAAKMRQRLLGYVSQHSTLADFLSARENVELALSLRGFDRDEVERRAERWLDWVGLAKLADRRADRLSGGEQRRVALARALAPEPRVLLADEPTAQLDQLSGRVVIRLLEQVAHETGATVIAASHDPDLIVAADARLTLAGRAMEMGETETPQASRAEPPR